MSTVHQVTLTADQVTVTSPYEYPATHDVATDAGEVLLVCREYDDDAPIAVLTRSPALWLKLVDGDADLSVSGGERAEYSITTTVPTYVTVEVTP